MPIIEILKKPFDDSNNWLARYASNVASQTGEDGIIQKIIEIIGVKSKYCVEFGAWDGRYLSNTYNLIENYDWNAALIEGSLDRFIALSKTFKNNKKVKCINKFIGFEEHNCLDRVLEKIGAPKSFDILSIDIDGNDFHVWQATKLFKPRLVIIEFNPAIPNEVMYIQDKDMSMNKGSSLLAMSILAKQKGYEMVCVTTANAFFVLNELYHLFGIENNSVEAMHDDQKFKTIMFQLYDGSIEIAGIKELLWSGVFFSAEDLQVLPPEKRKLYGD